MSHSSGIAVKTQPEVSAGQTPALNKASSTKKSDGKFSLTENFTKKLNRENVLLAKDKVVKNQIFNKIILEYKHSVDEIMVENQESKKEAAKI